MFVYVGAYTEPSYDGRAEGISVFRFDDETGTLTPAQTIAGVPNPSFLALDAAEGHLYAVNELPEGGVSAFARDPETGTLTALNRQLSHGADPCYLSLDPSGRFLLVANYSGGTVAVLPIAVEGAVEEASCVIHHQGSSVSAARQEMPHPHMVAPTSDGRLVVVSDLGIDQLVLYRLNAESGQLVPNEPGAAFVRANPGAGPRHFAFSPDGRFLYAINELDSTLTVFAYDGEEGELTTLQTVSTLPAGFTGENDCAHVAVSTDGRFVYGSNRGHDSIAIWRVDGESGMVSLVRHEPTGGKTPRNFALAPGGKWLLAANQDTHSIVTFRRDEETGELTASGAAVETPSPVAILFSRV